MSDDQPDPPADKSKHRPIKSFVVRPGRMGTGQAKALAELSPRFVLPFKHELVKPAEVFGRTAPVVFEIGFGMGAATAQIATTLPDVDFIGCEVHEPGVGALLKLIGEQELNNIRIFQHDAVEVLEHMIAPGSLAGMHIFFPDPWHKKRHNKRRLIQTPFVAKLIELPRPRRLPALRHRLAALCRADAGGAQRRARLLQNTAERLCREAGLPAHSPSSRTAA